MDAEFSLLLQQRDGYRFEVDFGAPGIAPLMTDEPPPLGTGSGPNPARLLVAAVTNCLAASLTFALRKFHNEPAPLRAEALCRLTRNEAGRWRIGSITVALHLGDAAAALKQLDRALAQFEDFCIVTQSVRAGIAVQVAVFDRDGVRLAGAAEALT